MPMRLRTSLPGLMTTLFMANRIARAATLPRRGGVHDRQNGLEPLYGRDPAGPWPLSA